MKHLILTVSVALMVAGCAAQPTAAPLPPKIALEAPSREPVPLPPTGAQILAAQRPEIAQAVTQHEQSGTWPTFTTAPGYVLYPYGENPQPVVDCAVLRTTDVQLQPGETVTDLAIGDQERWMATPASSGDPRQPVPHVALKPQAPAIETDLTIYTTKHIYHLLLRARPKAMQEVAFYYPDELLSTMKQADKAAAEAAAANAKQQSPHMTPIDPPADDAASGVVKIAAVDPSQLNFSYTVSGPNVAWKPVRAFDDGTHVYIEMAAAMKTSAAPALMITAGGGTQMVNYRVEGNYYVVDRLLNDAILVSGVGRDQDRVTIAYVGTAR
ncbi:MAG: TrbG/VirB9 family P-type conjugative transfer protein [Candidatus Binataceae bacterium]